jgi:Tol biopolymer transport system component
MDKLILLTVVMTAFLQTTNAQMVFQKEIDNKRLIVLADIQGQNQKVISDPTKDTYHPEISSSGRYVAYSEGVIAPSKTMMQIVIQDLGTLTKEVWTALDNQFIHSEFSGNEKFLVYSGPNPKTKKQNIYIIDLFKERLKRPVKTAKIVSTANLSYRTIETYRPNPRVIESSYDCYAPAVSSDGSLIVYHRTENKNDKRAPKQLVVYNTQTLQEFTITDADKHAMFPSISSDDRYIAYVSQDGGQWDIYAYDLWTKTKKQLTNDPEIEFTPSFNSKDEIYFTRFTPPNPGAVNQSFGIDIYFLPENALTQNNFVSPKVFLDDLEAAEYVQSFKRKLRRLSKT